MKLVDIINGAPLKEIRDQVHTFTDHVLSDYLRKVNLNLEFNSSCYKQKDIHDAVWGTIDLNPGEVIIIDSPLIQRLRRISHLGLAGLLFPGADYSRFEHTLGVLNVASKISKKVQNDPAISNILKKSNLNPTQIVRLAAIFHDAGHMIFSHASERFFSESPSFSKFKNVKKVLNSFGANTCVTNPKLSELISVLMVTSPPVIDLLKISWPHLNTDMYRSEGELVEFSGLISSLIIGIPVREVMVPFHRIISGPIDADKCDYLARDSSHTGVPVAVDLYRVIQKLRLIEGVPENMGIVWDEAIKEGDETYLLGFSFSAVKSVEEVMVSRTLMHEKIYYHHKILTAEEMLRQALKFLDISKFENIQDFNYILRLNDSDILSNLPEEYFEAMAKANGLNTNFIKDEFYKACTLIRMLIQRDLLKRACALSEQYMHITPISTNGGMVDITLLLTDLFESVDIEKQKEFIDDICGETIKILRILSKDNQIDHNIFYLTIPVFCPQALNSSFDIPIECGGKYKRSADFFPAETWDNSRKVTTNYNYIVARPDIIKETFIATEKVLFNKYGIILDPECHEIAKISDSEISKIKSELIPAKYYQDAYQLIPDTVFNLSQLSDIESLLDKFRPYNGPMGYKITSINQITSFLKQFAVLGSDNYELFAGLIELLDKVEVVDRSAIFKSLSKTFGEISSNFECSPGEIVYAVVGGFGDSSSHISYFIKNDLKAFFGEKIEINSIANILSNPDNHGKPIVFVDDAFYSGKQIISIFQEMCGVVINDREIKEHHNINLPGELIPQLKASKIGICYCYQNPDTLSEVMDKITSLDIDLHVFCAHEFPEPLFKQRSFTPFSNSERKSLVENAFKEIGTQLLNSTKKMDNGDYKAGWGEERCENFSLGYNDAQQLIVFPWNTPTYTLTPLWCRGTLEDGTNWTPLFPRQSKD